MNTLKTLGKSALGLIYTTIIMFAVWFGLIWLTQYLLLFNWGWGWAIAFWLIGFPLLIGFFQFLATVTSIPTLFLFKGTKAWAYLLIPPALYFIIKWGYLLFQLASAVGGLLTWLLIISWFCETAWFFGAYVFIALGSAFEDD